MPVVKCRSCGREITIADNDHTHHGLCQWCSDLPASQPTFTSPPTLDSSPPRAVPAGEPSGEGAAIPGYEILSELGRGGMGVVYKARQTALNRIVALKVILVGAHASPSDRARFRTEAEAVARLKHPNILQVYDLGESAVAGTAATIPYLSLEFCAGGALNKHLEKGPLSPQLSAGLVETLARAVHHAHEAKVIHRDLKPANVLFDERGVPKLADFGLAKKLDEEGHTVSGAVMGTPAYVSPEQAQGKIREIGPATDVYSLGAILYECLCGRPPFRGESAMDTLLSVITAPVPPLPATVPLPLRAICERCMQKKPQDRYPTAKALADDLRRYLGGQQTAAEFVAPLPRPRQTDQPASKAGWLYALLALLVLSLVAGGAYWMLRDGKKDEPETPFDAFRLSDHDGEMMRQKVTQGTGKGVAAIAWSPDATLIATADAEGYVGLWDLKKKGFMRTKVAEKGLTSVVFDAKGERLLVGDEEGGVSLWQTDLTGPVKPGQPIPPARARRALFRGREGEVLICLEQEVIRRWNPDTDGYKSDLAVASKAWPLLDAAVRPGHDQLVVAGGGAKAGDLTLIDLGTGKPVRSFPFPPGTEPGLRPVRCAFTADGAFVVSGEENGKIRLWEPDSGKCEYTFDGHQAGPVTAIATTWRDVKTTGQPRPQRRRAVTAGGDGKILLIDLERNAYDKTFDAGKAPVRSLSFSPDGRHFASAGDDGVVRVWGIPAPMKQ